MEDKKPENPDASQAVAAWQAYLDTEFSPAAVKALSDLRQQSRPDSPAIEKLTIRQFLESFRDHLTNLAEGEDLNNEFIPTDAAPYHGYDKILINFGLSGYDKITGTLKEIGKEDSTQPTDALANGFQNMQSALRSAINFPWQQAVNKENVRFCLEQLQATSKEILGSSPHK